MTYKEKAKLLLNSNFFIGGYGHFNVCLEEIAYILELIDKGDKKELNNFYEKLSKERLG